MSDVISTPTSAKISYASLLRELPAFRALWFGQTISQLGDSLYYLVFLFMVERLTGDAKMVGIAGVAQTLPFLLLSPYAGVVADRWDRRRILLLCDLFSALALIVFALYVYFDPKPPAWTLIAAGALLSSINAFFAPAKGAAIPQLVPEEQRTVANALSLATQNLMPMIGIALSGTALAAVYAISPNYFFLSSISLNAFSFLLSALFIARLPSLIPVHDSPSDEPQKASGAGQAWQDVRDGFHYLKNQHVLWVLLWLNVCVQATISPFMLVYVQVNKEWFGGGYGTLAFCEIAFFVGVVICSLFVEKMNIKRPGMAFIGGITAIGITVVIMAVSRTPATFAWWNFLAGIAFPFVQLPMAVYIQKVVPQHFQGRVNAAMTMTGMGIAPVSIGLGGLLLAAIGPAGMLIAMGGGMAAAGLLGLADKAFREAGYPPAPKGVHYP